MDPRSEAHNLIDLAMTVIPEDEGMIDLNDRDYSLYQLAELRATLATMRKAIDVASAGLAQAWVDTDRIGSVVIGNTTFKLGYGSKSPRWAHDDAAIDFAQWLKKQSDEEVAAIVPAYGMRVGQLPEAARTTFLNEERTDGDLRIKYNNDDFIYRKATP